MMNEVEAEQKKVLQAEFDQRIEAEKQRAEAEKNVDIAAAVTSATDAERKAAEAEFAERLYAYHIHVLRPQTNPQLCPQQGTRGEARGRAEDPAQTERAGCHRAEGSGERHDD